MNKTRDALVAFLEGELEKIKVRKGPYSKLATTLEQALGSHLAEDLDAARFACGLFDRYGDEHTLPEARAMVRESNLRNAQYEAMKRARQQRENEKRRWAGDLANKVEERGKFRDVFVSEGIDFSRPDTLSTRRMRHVAASKPRKKSLGARRATSKSKRRK